MTVSVDPSGESFTASRWTKGNFLFPTRIVVTPEHVLRVKPRLFGSTQESIAIPAVASVQISTGVFWSDIRIDSAGGTNPVLSHGHRKGDAERIRDLIEDFSGGGSDNLESNFQDDCYQNPENRR